MIHCRLVKGGFARSIGEAESLPARVVLQVLNYENFLGEYEEEFIALNAPEK